jgi:EmrB/QacA subfamily drug resistance transporter
VAKGPVGARTGWTLILASIGAFLVSLDVVIVATALPVIRTDLGASLSDLEWTINAYNLVFACLMLTGSALGDRFGRRRMYILGLIVFAGASAAAALSTTATELIMFRVVQGAGAAVLLPLSLTLISDAFPVEKRGVAIGIWGGVAGLGVAMGPVIGGVIVENVDWSWIFWFNVPVALATAVLSSVRLRESHGPRPQLDILGLVLVGAGMFALTSAPVRAPDIGWADSEVIGALIVGVLLIAAFVVWEGRARYPMVPLAYFRSRGFTTANVVIFFQYISLIGSLFFITQLFEIGLGYSPLDTGVRLLVWMATPMFVAPIAGGLADKFGNKPFMVLGMLLQTVGLGWLTLVVETGVSYGTLVAPLIVAGIGISMCFPTTSNAVVGSVPLEDAGVASGTNTSLREVGGVFGIAILAATFAANGSYNSPASFIDGVKPALAVAALVPIIGLLAALVAPGRKEAMQVALSFQTAPTPVPAVAEEVPALQFTAPPETKSA